MRCRHCDSPVSLSLIDLSSAPPSNAYLSPSDLNKPEVWLPLRVDVCESCWLVQTEDVADAESLFHAEYAYFSGISRTWHRHCEAYAEAMIERFRLNASSHVVEVAANDGTLLSYFQTRGVGCLGIEPTSATARSAREKGIDIEEAFFGDSLAQRLASEGRQADLIAANNVLAHVPNINDFLRGFASLLKPEGVATFEFPHVVNMIEQTQFDTIYHEHFSYLSLTTVRRMCEANGLRVFDVEKLATHGGSLRVYAHRADQPARHATPLLQQLLAEEAHKGVCAPAFYQAFQSRADRIKRDLLTYLINAKQAGKVIAGYGAAAKGNTLLNYAGVRSDLLSCVADRSAAKQGLYLPGSRIPIVSEQALIDMRPDAVLILPWNLRDEVVEQLSASLDESTVYLTAVPELQEVACAAS
jgi:SAM-dependent methyltransferase